MLQKENCAMFSIKAWNRNSVFALSYKIPFLLNLKFCLQRRPLTVFSGVPGRVLLRILAWLHHLFSREQQQHQQQEHQQHQQQDQQQQRLLINNRLLVYFFTLTTIFQREAQSTFFISWLMTSIDFKQRHLVGH